MLRNGLKIMEINTNGWTTKRILYGNVFREIDADIILISEHGIDTRNTEMKIWNYDVLITNFSQDRYDGAAIAIKKGIKYKQIRNLEESYLAIEVELDLGKLVIATGYQPPRRDVLPIHTLTGLFGRRAPTILMGDLNARCRESGYKAFNGIGRSLDLLLDRNIA